MRIQSNKFISFPLTTIPNNRSAFFADGGRELNIIVPYTSSTNSAQIQSSPAFIIPIQPSESQNENEKTNFLEKIQEKLPLLFSFLTMISLGGVSALLYKNKVSLKQKTQLKPKPQIAQKTNELSIKPSGKEKLFVDLEKFSPHSRLLQQDNWGASCHLSATLIALQCHGVDLPEIDRKMAMKLIKDSDPLYKKYLLDNGKISHEAEIGGFLQCIPTKLIKTIEKNFGLKIPHATHYLVEPISDNFFQINQSEVEQLKKDARSGKKMIIGCYSHEKSSLKDFENRHFAVVWDWNIYKDANGEEIIKARICNQNKSELKDRFYEVDLNELIRNSKQLFFTSLGSNYANKLDKHFQVLWSCLQDTYYEFTRQIKSKNRQLESAMV